MNSGQLIDSSNWIKMINRYKNTCIVCNRAIFKGDEILWNPDISGQSRHLPEMCEWLGYAKKRVSTRALGTNPRAKGTNPRSKNV